MLTADAVGGVWQYTVSLANALVQDGVAVLVATMGPRPSHSQRVELPPSVELAESDFALEWTVDPWLQVDAAGNWLLSLARQFNPEIVHLNGYVHAVLSWRVPIMIVAHSCVLSWWQAVHGCPAPDHWNEYRLRVQGGLRACHKIVTPSAFLANEIAAIYSIDRSKIAIIHNGLSIEAPQQREAPEQRSKESLCLAAGRLWDEAKNLALLRAISEGTAVPIYLAGDNSGTPHGSLHLLGQLPHSELLGWMARARLFVHPALYEPFGLVILEAAHARCCLLLADTVSARELWDGAALFLDPHQPDEWIAAINRLSVNIDEFAQLAAAAYARSLEFNSKLFADQYRQIYSDILNRPSVAA